jgi:hypothetical protein
MRRCFFVRIPAIFSRGVKIFETLFLLLRGRDHLFSLQFRREWCL